MDGVSGAARKEPEIAYLKILCGAIPDIYTLEIGVVAVVKGSTWSIEFIRKLKAFLVYRTPTHLEYDLPLDFALSRLLTF